jgi:hypothetical protein
MHVPTEDELAAIAVAYLTLMRATPPPVPVVSRWRAAARALDDDDMRRPRRPDAGRPA